MLQPIITLWGMYRYDDTLFETLNIPDALSKEVMLNYIYMYAGNNECRYGEPTVLKTLIKNWSAGRLEEWNRILKAMTADYSPIENYNRIEETREKRTEDRNKDEKENSNRNYNSNQIGGIASNSDSNTEQKVSAFNAETYQPKSKAEDVAHSDTTSTENRIENSAMNLNRNANENVDTESLITNNTHGNIGVTTNQNMIESEIELRKKNLYKMIALEIEDEFTIPVYGRRCNNELLL